METTDIYTANFKTKQNQLKNRYGAVIDFSQSA